MRDLKRIPVLINLLKNDNNKRIVLEHYFKPEVGVQLEIGMPYFEINDYIGYWNLLFNDFETTWFDYPDSRLSQVLIYNNIIPNHSGIWYYIEDDELLTLLQ
jgi:hypothetical protein